MQAALEAQLAEAHSAHAAEVATLAQQLEEAHRLADFSSRELAGVVQQLAAVSVRPFLPTAQPQLPLVAQSVIRLSCLRVLPPL